nr:MAG TPA: Structural protein [Crassvirales sp.]
MSVTSLRQNRQFYVANKLVTGATALANKGEIKVKSIGDIEKEVYFEVLGPDTVLKSDYIQVKNITAAKAIKAVDMETPMKKVLVTLDSSVNGGTPVVGQDYILRINLRQFYGMSDQDQYFKDAAVRAVKGMTAKQFYEAMEKALNLCFSREVGANAKSNPYLAFSSSAAGLVIEEKPQSWHLGTEAQERVYFDVVPTTVYDGTTDLIWGSVAEQTATTKIGNGKKIADLEYFLLGERGDQYRKIGWPNDVETVGMVDPDKTYDVFEIHYAFTDTGVNSYRSEKDITIAVPTAVKSTDGGGADYTVINDIIGAFNTATGLNVATLK